MITGESKFMMKAVLEMIESAQNSIKEVDYFWDKLDTQSSAEGERYKTKMIQDILFADYTLEDAKKILKEELGI